MKNKFQSWMDVTLEFKLKSAHDFVLQGKHLHAIQIYKSIIEEEPKFVDTYFHLAELYEQMNNFDSAINLLKTLLEKNPDDKDTRLYTAQFLLRNFKWEEAIEVLSFISPEEEHIVSFFLGYSHFMLNDFELAKINFENFIQIDEREELYYEANLYLSKIEIELKHFKTALECAQKTEVIYSNFWELKLIYAICYYNLNMFAHAVNPVNKAIELNPKEAKCYEWAGKIYLKEGNYLKAEKNFLKCVELRHDVSSEVYSKLGEACLRAKKTEDALNYFDIALKLDPENKFADAGKKNAATILGGCSIIKKTTGSDV